MLAIELGGVHQAALRNSEHRGAVAPCACIVGTSIGKARGRRCAVRCRAGRNPGRDRHGAGSRFKLERAGFERLECALVPEEDDLAESFAAGLKSSADFGHGAVADQLTMRIDAAMAERCAYDEAGFADRGKHNIAIAMAKESCAFGCLAE